MIIVRALMAWPELLAVTGGHSFDGNAFTGLVDSVASTLSWTGRQVSAADADTLLTATNAGAFAAVLLYDLPGLDLRRGHRPTPVGPDPATRRRLSEWLDAGQGLVALHHALAGWPAWDGWAAALGGRFLYAPGALRGEQLPASGYRWASVAIDVVADHPVCDGVESFVIDDELYRCPVFESEVAPLLSTTADPSTTAMIDTFAAVIDGVQRPASAGPGSRLVGWATSAGRSPIVYLQPGHGPATMAHPMYRRLVANACRWVASTEAHEWAGSRGRDVRP